MVWTRYVLWSNVATLERDIYFARQNYRRRGRRRGRGHVYVTL